jgi:hypothetical protein
MRPTLCGKGEDSGVRSGVGCMVEGIRGEVQVHRPLFVDLYENLEPEFEEA